MIKDFNEYLNKFCYTFCKNRMDCSTCFFRIGLPVCLIKEAIIPNGLVLLKSLDEYLKYLNDNDYTYRVSNTYLIIDKIYSESYIPITCFLNKLVNIKLLYNISSKSEILYRIFEIIPNEERMSSVLIDRSIFKTYLGRGEDYKSYNIIKKYFCKHQCIINNCIDCPLLTY